ncbi:hypothetical protein BV898_02910 [Hypsibius exemplaris]|uniref:Insulin-like growth factor-binding protein complex acid labile subunit n=1 Tax=Hypsibius exemplaris TaxID=2072580 RepID=A0A1W0X6K5_HYPEX|nr:hypothetical protein BV898_02910 [Hypsibius exemplaris]
MGLPWIVGLLAGLCLASTLPETGECQMIGPVLPIARGNCPLLTSGKCWVDCNPYSTDFEIHHILCEDVDYYALHGDLGDYASKVRDSKAMIEVALTVSNSPNITTVETNMLYNIRNHLNWLSLHHMNGLVFFPLLVEMKNLTQIHIKNCSSLTEMDLALLPPSIEYISIENTGVSRLEYRLTDPARLPRLTTFTFQQNPLKYIEEGFFLNFPELTTLLVTQNQVSTPTVSSDKLFRTTKPLMQFAFSGNKFEGDGVTDDLRRRFFEAILNSVVFDANSNAVHFDLSDNSLLISPDAVKAFPKLAAVTHLGLRGNTFDTTVATTGFLRDLPRLISLDLSSTFVPQNTGMFQGLPQLIVLRLDSNMFGDMGQADHFQGLESKTLYQLFLSGNSLEALPAQSFIPFRSNIQSLELENNRLKLDETTFAEFPRLRSLSLKSNGLRTFNSAVLRGLTQLNQLDLSCNPLTLIDRNTFSELSSQLNHLDLSWCQLRPFTDATAPVVTNDAFEGLKSVSVLIMSNGFLRETILPKLNRLPAKNLAILNLDNNGIRSLNPRDLSTLTIGSLSLRNNQMQQLLWQNISFSGNGNWAQLHSLDLSDNQITSLEEIDTRGLTGLSTLRLERNGLIRVFPGVFDNLPLLNAVYLSGNRLNAIHHFFEKTGEQLLVLSVDNNHIRRLAKSDLIKMKNLTRLDLHGNPLHHLEEGIFDILKHDQDHADSWVLSLVLTNLTCGCSTNGWLKRFVNEHRFNNFQGMILEDPANYFGPHAAYSHVPRCNLENGRRIFITEPEQPLCAVSAAISTTAIGTHGGKIQVVLALFSSFFIFAF